MLPDSEKPGHVFASLATNALSRDLGADPIFLSYPHQKPLAASTRSELGARPSNPDEPKWPAARCRSAQEPRNWLRSGALPGHAFADILRRYAAGVAEDLDSAALVLADSTTQTGKDIQAGYRFLFMSSQQAVRNPAAHEEFGEPDDDEAFELFGLASLLMRKLYQVTPV